MVKLPAPTLKWKKGDIDAHRVLDSWTLAPPSFDEPTVPHEIFEKFFTTEKMERICLESNKYARHKGNHSFMMTIKKLKSFIAILLLSGYNLINCHDKKCIGRGGRTAKTEWPQR